MEVRDRRSGRAIDWQRLWKIQWQYIIYAQLACHISNTFSKLGVSLHLQTLVEFSPALPYAATRTQWPVPQACLRGMPNFSTSHVPSRGHHAPCCPRVTNILSLAIHRAPIPLAADCALAVARRFDRRIVSFEL